MDEDESYRIWERAEALWWAEVKVKGYLSAYCDAACDEVNDLDKAVDELVRARAKAEAALVRARAASERAEAFAILASKVIDRPDALLDAACRLDALKPLKRVAR